VGNKKPTLKKGCKFSHRRFEMKWIVLIILIVWLLASVLASDPTRTPVLAPQFHVSVLVSNLQGSASPSAISYAGQFFYNAGAGLNSTAPGSLTYDLRDFSIGAATARIVVEATESEYQFYHANGMTGACSSWTAPSQSGLLWDVALSLHQPRRPV